MLVSLLRKIGLAHAPEHVHAQDGRKPEGPPDLDQMWRDFNLRISRMFGQKGDGGGGRNNNMKGAGVVVGVAAGIVLTIWLASGAYIVQEGQTALVTTFGRYSYKAPPGFNWRWPAPFQDHEIVNVSQVRTVEIGYSKQVRNKVPKEALMLTDDENIIDIQFAVQYTLNDPVKWLFKNREPEDNLRQVAETSIREVVGKSKMDFVLYEGREAVAKDVLRLMQQILDRYDAGVLVTNVTMQGVQPPEQVQVAFDDAVKAVQDKERQKNEGQAYANDVIPKARGNAARLLQEAEAYRAQVSETAAGNASRFSQVLAEYQKAPAVTRDRMYLDTMQQIYANTSKVMVDAKSGSNLLYLPLDKLIAQSGADSHPAPAPAAAAPAAAPVMETTQTFEQVRQREPRNRDTSRDRESR